MRSEDDLRQRVAALEQVKMVLLFPPTILTMGEATELTADDFNAIDLAGLRHPGDTVCLPSGVRAEVMKPDNITLESLNAELAGLRWALEPWEPVQRILPHKVNEEPKAPYRTSVQWDYERNVWVDAEGE